MNARRAAALALTLALALAAAPSGSAASGASTAKQAAAPPDPESDVVGWEDGYWHNESIAVDQQDGLSDAETEAYVARATARVEYLRDREFETDVPVAVESREAFRNRTGGAANATHAAWNNQVWEALFLVGEGTDANEAIEETTAGSVAGYYDPESDEIRVITDTPDTPRLDNATLVHELVHALQDQHENLSDPRFGADTQDGDLAVDGLVEGEAAYVERRYAERCGTEWDCVASPGGPAGGDTGDVNVGVLLTIFQPYSDGAVYVDSLLEAGGWDAVDAAYEELPASTEQTIHHTDETPEPLAFEDRSTEDWSLFDAGENGSDTVGEASVYVLFWKQTQSGAGIVSFESFAQTDHPYDRYNYSAPPSAGWANDRLFPYRNESGGEDGYVWTTAWDTERDAEQFHDAYRRVLDHRGARAVGEQTWVNEEGAFADAFHVVRDGRTVTVVNGPTVASLSEIRGVEVETTTTGSAGQPGLGVAVAVVALLAVAVVRWWDR